MEVLCREAERGKLGHCAPIIVVAALAITKIEVTNSRRVLLNTRELRYIRGRFFVAHIDAIVIVLLQDPIHVVGIFLTAVVRHQFSILRNINLLSSFEVRKFFILSLFTIPVRPIKHVVGLVTKLTIRMSYHGFWDLSHFFTIHIITIMEVSFAGLTTIIVMREHFSNLLEDFQTVRGCAVRTCNGSNIKRRDPLSESAVRISRCQIDHNPICNIGALRGVKRVREGDGARVMLNDNYILVFHMNVPPKNLYLIILFWSTKIVE